MKRRLSSKSKSPRQIMLHSPDRVLKLFLQGYQPDSWLCRWALIKEAHDQFETLKPSLLRELEDISDEDFKKVLRLEMHFLYFQMTEALFELICAVLYHDNRLLWPAMSFSGDRKTHFYRDIYGTIRSCANGTWEDLMRTIEIPTEGGTKKIPAIQWVFYFYAESKMPPESFQKSLESIASLLRTFATDFCSRDDYNAYKHGLGFLSGPVSLTIRNEATGQGASLKADDSTSCLKVVEHADEPDDPTLLKLRVAIKGFDFERDCRCCLAIQTLIANIVDNRRHVLLDEFKGKPYTFTTYSDVKVDEIIRSSAQLRSFEHDV